MARPFGLRFPFTQFKNSPLEESQETNSRRQTCSKPHTFFFIPRNTLTWMPTRIKILSGYLGHLQKFTFGLPWFCLFSWKLITIVSTHKQQENHCTQETCTLENAEHDARQIAQASIKLCRRWEQLFFATSQWFYLL